MDSCPLSITFHWTWWNRFSAQQYFLLPILSNKNFLRYDGIALKLALILFDHSQIYTFFFCSNTLFPSPNHVVPVLKVAQTSLKLFQPKAHFGHMFDVTSITNKEGTVLQPLKLFACPFTSLPRDSNSIRRPCGIIPQLRYLKDVKLLGTVSESYHWEKSLDGCTSYC